MGIPISSILKNTEKILVKGEATLKQAEKMAGSTASKVSPNAEKFASKVTSFNKDDLKTMENGLGKYPDEAVSKMKEMATSLLHDLSDVTGRAVENIGKEIGKEMGGRFRNTISAGIKDFAQELLGSENYKALVSVLKGLRSGVKHLSNFVAEVKADPDIAQARAGASTLAREMKAFYRQ